VSTTSHQYAIHTLQSTIRVRHQITYEDDAGGAKPPCFLASIDFMYIGIAEFPNEVKSTTVSTENFHHWLNYFLLDCTGKNSNNVTMVDGLIFVVVVVLFCVLEFTVCTNVGSCPFHAGASHFFFCYQI
jgi:hypothetical protein